MRGRRKKRRGRMRRVKKRGRRKREKGKKTEEEEEEGSPIIHPEEAKGKKIAEGFYLVLFFTRRLAFSLVSEEGKEHSFIQKKENSKK